ncbi:MAG: hypothetical protein CM1200mP34_0020 [Verrucomicrobiales bacterium]|nr:MAG: hypothetical protein CM1200mP34_0020 [Verrucomicrobiales bacterium]
MQTSVPELMDFSGEPRHVLDAYGVDGMDGSFAANCLLARRLAERGTRFIHLYHGAGITTATWSGNENLLRPVRPSQRDTG